MLSDSLAGNTLNTIWIEKVFLCWANTSCFYLILTEADIVALPRYTSANFLTERLSVPFELKPFDVRLGLQFFKAVSCEHEGTVDARRRLEVADEGHHELAVGVEEEEAEDEHYVHDEDEPLALRLGLFGDSHFVLE